MLGLSDKMVDRDGAQNMSVMKGRHQGIRNDWASMCPWGVT